jgi:hypothetical protein
VKRRRRSEQEYDSDQWGQAKVSKHHVLPVLLK